MEHTITPTREELKEDNARLLLALIDIMKFCDSSAQDEDDETEWERSVRVARACIAKSEGR